MIIADKLNGCTDEMSRIDIEEMSNQSNLDWDFNKYLVTAWLLQISLYLEIAAYICIACSFIIYFACIAKDGNGKIVPQKPSGNNEIQERTFFADVNNTPEPHDNR